MKKTGFLAFLIVLVSTSLAAKDNGYKVENEWKYKTGKNSLWVTPNYDDSSWETLQMPIFLPLGGEENVCLRTTVTIPHGFDGNPVYIDAGHAYGAFDIYVDGILLGSNGKLPPNQNVRPRENTVLLIPENLIHNNKINLTYVYWTACDVLEIIEPPVIMGPDQIRRITYYRETLNNSIYVIIAVLCLAMGVYMIIQYLLNRKKGKTFLWFALSSLCISFYFYDMGAKQAFLPFIFQRELARSLLIISMGFLFLFFQHFMEQQVKKWAVILVFSIDAVCTIGHFAMMGNWVLVSNFFTYSLIPVVLVNLYGIVISIIGLIKKRRKMGIVLAGFLSAVGLAFVDVVVMFQGGNPFVWLQGYAFFIVIFSVFLTISVDSVKNQKVVDRLIDEGTEQNVKLAGLFEQARVLSMDTTEIAGNLNVSVKKVSEVSQNTMDQVRGIEDALLEQNNTLEAVDDAVENLIHSLTETNENLEKEAESIAFSAEQTARLMSGFQSVGNSISGAADKAQALDDLTLQNEHDVNLLKEAMDDMKSRSDEIITIVQVLDNFSKRTNLLAMNASIEAAHAGVAGKGFAVVANEIKNLAAQSSAQAQRISENIDEISQSIESGANLTEGVQKTLSQMRKEASDTANHVRSAAEEMKRQQGDGERIEEEARKISDAAEQMKKAAFEQFNYSDSVKNSMEQLRDATKAVDDAACAIANATRLLSDNVSGLKTMSEKTSETSDRLSQMMML
ncbi:MAG: hypothetical protein HUK25_09420 [Treponema sp.]|nr:hypothetical protein [Treponema sp.]